MANFPNKIGSTWHRSLILKGVLVVSFGRRWWKMVTFLFMRQNAGHLPTAQICRGLSCCNWWKLRTSISGVWECSSLCPYFLSSRQIWASQGWNFSLEDADIWSSHGWARPTEAGLTLFGLYSYGISFRISCCPIKQAHVRPVFKPTIAAALNHWRPHGVELESSMRLYNVRSLVCTFNKKVILALHRDTFYWHSQSTTFQRYATIIAPWSQR